MRAEQALDQASELVDATDAHIYQPEIHELRARLSQQRGDTLEADREFAEARRLYLEMGVTRFG
jgi:hypothetical protein